MLQSGAYIDAKDNDGNTSLMRVVKKPGFIDIELIKFLVENGANRDEKDNDGNTPAMLMGNKINEIHSLLHPSKK